MGRLAQGDHSPAVLCQSIKPVPGQDGRIAQKMGCSAGVDKKDVNRRAEIVLRQSAHFHLQYIPRRGGASGFAPYIHAHGH